MPFPLNVHDLINGLSVEWERLEFKTGWNPEAVLHTMCAFANDINNWGGGYIILGIDEINGKPVLPPVGMNPDVIDKIQKKLVELCHLISPNYFPVAAPLVYENRNIFVVWCPGGDVRPYKAVTKLSKDSPSAYFVRRFSSTVKASREEELQMIQLAAKVPYDDRINHSGEIEDISVTLIKEYLREVESDLYGIADKISFLDLCQQMQIVRGPKEYLKPVNIGLLMFNTSPTKFFGGAKIEVVEYQDDVGDSFTEKIFTGPLHHQLRSASQYIKNAVIKEKIRKIDGQAESERFFNYPLSAIEEALANAVYHRSYENLNPIEISVFKDHIDILSFPGPLPPVNDNDLKKERVVVRDYRNRRIGDFLKELHLTEGRGTGIPKIRRAMNLNGSPEPEFHTDESRGYFLTVLHINPDFSIDENKNVTENVTEDVTENVTENRAELLIQMMNSNKNITIEEMAKASGVTRMTVIRDLNTLKKKGLVSRVGSAKGGYWEVKK